MSTETIIQEREFKAGEYGELVLAGQPVMWDYEYETFPRSRAEQAGDYKQELVNPPLWGEESAPPEAEAEVATKGKAQERVVEEPRHGEGEEHDEPEQAAQDARFAEPRMVFYASSAPDMEWSKLRVVEKSERILWRGTAAAQRVLRLVHPKGCPFEGRVVIIGRG